MQDGDLVPKAQLVKEDQFKTIEYLSGLGLTVKQIATALGFNIRTFYKRVEDQEGVREALSKGRIKAKIAVTQSAYEMATDKEHPSMTMFWLTHQEGWIKEDDTTEQDEVEMLEAMSEEDRKKRIDHILNMRERIKAVRDVTPASATSGDEEGGEKDG